ncbi:hypothetical protein NG769_04335 [Aliarcobacter cryaerophilus]|uniref:hypothetical protein n=1 Tax=Aliarcobacter cryaerophilus TaxID=28198 RepID=UPI003DA2BB83
MISSLFTKFKGVLMAIFITAFAILGAYTFYLNYKFNSTKTQLAQKEKDYEELNIATALAIVEMNKALALEKDISKEKAINQNQKIEVLKHSQKVEQEIIKRGGVNKNEKRNPIIVNF